MKPAPPTMKPSNPRRGPITDPVLLRRNKLSLQDNMRLREIVDEQVENMFGRDDEGKLPRYEIYLKVEEKDKK